MSFKKNAVRNAGYATTRWPLACALVIEVSAAYGATATFTPVGSSDVETGQPVVFDVSVAPDQLSGFSGADIVIGSNEASDLVFSYSVAWLTSFTNVSPVTNDVGFYNQDVFIGGNNPSSVGSSMLVGRVTVQTVGLSGGIYSIYIDSSKDDHVSKLYLFVQPTRRDEPLAGVGVFSIRCAPLDAQCDGDIDIIDFTGFTGCANGPDESPEPDCERFDQDADADIDLDDFARFARAFTGER